MHQACWAPTATQVLQCVPIGARCAHSEVQSFRVEHQKFNEGSAPPLPLSSAACPAVARALACCMIPF